MVRERGVPDIAEPHLLLCQLSLDLVEGAGDSIPAHMCNLRFESSNRVLTLSHGSGVVSKRLCVLGLNDDEGDPLGRERPMSSENVSGLKGGSRTVLTG